MDLLHTTLADADGHLRSGIDALLHLANEPAVYASSGYRLMRNETHFLDRDGGWKTFVYRGSMYAELLGRRWPNQLLDLRGRVV